MVMGTMMHEMHMMESTSHLGFNSLSKCSGNIACFQDHNCGPAPATQLHMLHHRFAEFLIYCACHILHSIEGFQAFTPQHMYSFVLQHEHRLVHLSFLLCRLLQFVDPDCPRWRKSPKLDYHGRPLVFFFLGRPLLYYIFTFSFGPLMEDILSSKMLMVCITLQVHHAPEKGGAAN